MNAKLTSILLVIFTCFMLPAKAQQGFTNKAEAKNEMKNGVKVGKWIEYPETPFHDKGWVPGYYYLYVY